MFSFISILTLVSCTRYIESRKEERLKELQEKHTVAESELQSSETRKQEISAELKKSEDLIEKQDKLRRNIEDNINFRKTKAEVDELTHEIECLEDRVLKIGGISAIEAELTQMSKERERLLSEV